MQTCAAPLAVTRPLGEASEDFIALSDESEDESQEETQEDAEAAPHTASVLPCLVDEDVLVVAPVREEFPIPGVRPAGSTARLEDARASLLEASSNEDTGDEVYEYIAASLRRSGYFQPVDAYADGTLRRSARHARPQPGACADSEEEVEPEVAKGNWYSHVATGRDWFGASVCALDPQRCTSAFLLEHGFSIPLTLRCDSPQAACAALQMSLPVSLTVEDVVRAVGESTLIPTVDVAGQRDGPRAMTAAAWSAYWADPVQRRRRLLNCVSLSLARTPLAELVRPPAAVRHLDLVQRVWPSYSPTSEDQGMPPPEVLLYALMSPRGSYTDWHLDFGGSSVWYHLCSGSKVFLLAPPSAHNLRAFQRWASSEAQGRTWLGHSLLAMQRCEVHTGDTLLIPAGWLHCVATPSDAVALGGNFLVAASLRVSIAVEALEGRLGVAPAARFPQWTQLLWHTAAHYGRAHASGERALGTWERRGLAALSSALEGWHLCGDAQRAAPPVVGDVDALLTRLRACASPLPVHDLAEAEEACARLHASAQCGSLGASLTLHGCQAEGRRVCVLRGGRRGERWAMGTLSCFQDEFEGCAESEQAGGSFLVRFQKPCATPEARLRLHHCTLRDPAALPRARFRQVGPSVAGPPGSAQEDHPSSSEEDEDERQQEPQATKHAAAQHSRLRAPLPPHLRDKRRGGGLGMGGRRTGATSSASGAAASPGAAFAPAPAPVPPPRVTVAGLLRKGLREEASALAGEEHSAASAAHAIAGGAADAASPVGAAAERPLCAALRAFLQAASPGVEAPTHLSWSALLKVVLDHARRRGLRGAGGLIRCDAALEALLCRRTVQAAELSSLLRPLLSSSSSSSAHAAAPPQPAPRGSSPTRASGAQWQTTQAPPQAPPRAPPPVPPHVPMPVLPPPMPMRVQPFYGGFAHPHQPQPPAQPPPPLAAVRAAGWDEEDLPEWTGNLGGAIPHAMVPQPPMQPQMFHGQWAPPPPPFAPPPPQVPYQVPGAWQPPAWQQHPQHQSPVQGPELGGGHPQFWSAAQQHQSLGGVQQQGPPGAWAQQQPGGWQPRVLGMQFAAQPQFYAQPQPPPPQPPPWRGY